MRVKGKEEIENMLGMKMIDPAQTVWAFHVSLVLEKTMKYVIFVDYWKLNAVSLRDFYQISPMDECLDPLKDATMFSTLDANRGYWQVEIEEKDRDKTDFASRHGLYRFESVKFVHNNAPETFQDILDLISPTDKWQYALVYLEDSVISHIRWKNISSTFDIYWCFWRTLV